MTTSPPLRKSFSKSSRIRVELKETPVKFAKFSKNTCIEEHLRAAVSEYIHYTEVLRALPNIYDGVFLRKNSIASSLMSLSLILQSVQKPSSQCVP